MRAKAHDICSIVSDRRLPMKAVRALAAAAIVTAAAMSGPAAAHGVRFGFAFGFPVYPAPYYYPPPAYYYPPPVYAAPAPVYVEPPQARAAPQPENYWYYCADSRTYYPYVKQCASPWQKVVPRPPG
jgi:hypothetical protein